MRQTIRLSRGILILLLAGLLAACSGNRNPLEVRVQRCPALAVVGGTGTLMRFAGDGRTAADIVFEATIADLELECDQGSDVVSDVRFTIAASRGPALTSATEIVLPYFVAVLRDNSVIVAKKIYETRLRIGPDTQRAARREIIEQLLPTIEQARRYDYEILIGFQLTPEEVTYNLLR